MSSLAIRTATRRRRRGRFCEISGSWLAYRAEIIGQRLDLDIAVSPGNPVHDGGITCLGAKSFEFGDQLCTRQAANRRNATGAMSHDAVATRATIGKARRIGWLRLPD